MPGRGYLLDLDADPTYLSGDFWQLPPSGREHQSGGFGGASDRTPSVEFATDIYKVVSNEPVYQVPVRLAALGSAQRDAPHAAKALIPFCTIEAYPSTRPTMWPTSSVVSFLWTAAPESPSRLIASAVSHRSVSAPG